VHVPTDETTMPASHPITDTSADDTDSHQRVELWMRAHATIDVQDRQQAALDRLSRLEDEGIIAPLSVNTWGKHIDTADDTSPSSTATPALDKAREFERWSAQNGASLPGFQRHIQSSLLTSHTQEVFVTPILSLAIYEDNDLHDVIPNSGPEEYHTVTAYIESVATHDD
jgi:hypothetical protein